MNPGTQTGGIFFHGPVYGGSGYADENLHVVLGLARHGIPVQLDPRGARSDLGNLLSPPIRAELEELTKAKVDLQHSVLFVSAPAHEFQAQVYAQHTVGRTTFETDRIPDGWRERCNAMDEVWVPSRFNRETFAGAGVVEKKLHVLQEGIDTAHFQPGLAPLDIPEMRGFNFLSVFDWQKRKGYDVLLRAFCAEFRPDEDVALILKVSTANHPHAQPADLVSFFIERTLNMKLELACGRPVIATRWGGQLDFLNDENADLIELEGISPTGADIDLEIFAGHRWAEPSVDHLRQLLRRAVTDREASERKAARGLRDMAEKWDWRVVIPVWVQAFERLLNHSASQRYATVT